MNMPLNAAAELPGARAEKAKPGKRTYRLLIAAWILLVCFGVLATMLYTQYLQKKIASDIAGQTQRQLEQVQEDYRKQISELKDGLSGDITALQTKVNALNELLAFTKDSANSKTDSSNQLYTQLAEVKKKLDELQKNLDVLK